MTKRTILRLLSLLAAAVLAACGGDAADAPAPPSTASAARPSVSAPPGPAAPAAASPGFSAPTSSRPAAPPPRAVTRRSSVQDRGGSPVITGVSPARGSASGGTVVTVRGRNLDVAYVLVGDAVAPLAGPATPTAVRIVVPRQRPGAATIVVGNRDGSYATARAAYAYLGR